MKDDDNNQLPDLEEIIALMPGNIYWKDRNGVYLGCNDSAAELIHLKNRHEVIGKTLYDIAPRPIAEEITRIDDEIMSSGRESCVEEDAFDLKDDEATYFTRKVPLRNKSGDVIGLVGISIDITERKRYERELKAAKEKAESANKAKSEFIMNMSHDIRTPFSGILGLSQFLADKETDTEKKDFLNSIVESAENLLTLLNEVIHLASLEQDAEDQISRFDLKAIVDDIYKTMIPVTKQKGLDLILTIDPSLPSNVLGNEYAVKRILLNLVGNAIKFTEIGKVCISLALKEKDENQCIVDMSVSDTGIGIPKNKQETIFGQFSKLNSSYKGKYGGTGLGLWFVKQLTKKINGEITVSSEPRKGATFTVVFPLEEVD